MLKKVSSSVSCAAPHVNKSSNWSNKKRSLTGGNFKVSGYFREEDGIRQLLLHWSLILRDWMCIESTISIIAKTWRSSVTSCGVLGELGRYPIILYILQGAVKYWQNLQRKRMEKYLFHDCLCKAEVIDAMESTSWISWMKLICNELNINNLRDISTPEIK